LQERGFVDALIKTIHRQHPGATTLRASDNYTLGIPDLMIWIPLRTADGAPILRRTWSLAIEAKALHPLMPDPFHRGRRIGQMLKHPFTGPQISLLRMMARSGVDAFGLVRASEDTAFRIHPDALPAETGNFTYDEMVAIGRPIKREHNLWLFSSGEAHDQVPGAGHRGDPGDGTSG
jgi:hypothetical protein